MTQPNDGQPRRAPWGVLFILCMLWIGLAAGTAIGARFVPPGSGLAGPAIALGYGVLGAVMTGLLAGLLTARLPARRLRAAAAASALLAVLILGWTGWAMIAQLAERRAESGLDRPLPPPSPFRIEAHLSEADSMRSFRELSVDGSDWTFRYVAVGPEAAACTGQLIADEAAQLQERLGAVEQRISNGEQPCAATVGPELMTIDFDGSIYSGAPARQWKMAASMECLQQESDVAALGTILRRIPIDAVSHARVRCD
jgi:hypothetical protein